MLTNKHGIGLSVALMLATDDYDHDYRPNAFSATGLLKPLRVLALSIIHKDKLTGEIDVTNLVASSTGTAVHDRLENTWLNPKKVKAGLARLGYKDAKVLVNPTDEELKNSPNHAVVYVEIRNEKTIIIDEFKLILTGKFDIVLQGKLEDLKNTGTFKVIKALKELEWFKKLKSSMNQNNIMSVMDDIANTCPTIFEYCIQGSIYKFLNPKIIVEDFMSIQFIMKDWYKGQVGKAYYPSVNPYQFDIDLFTSNEIKTWIYYRINDLNDIIKTNSIPYCTDAELWRNPPEFKVYKDHSSKRALPKGTFANYADAQAFSKKRKVPGDVRLIPSTPKRCNYCNTREVCDQYAKFIVDGLLKKEE